MYKDLLKKATAVSIKVKLNDLCSIGSVGCALITDQNNIYIGICLDSSCGVGLCAETSAIASMISNGESRIKAITAVTNDGRPVSPCGKCRELISQVNFENMATDIILEDKVVKLKYLLPNHWFIKKKIAKY